MKLRLNESLKSYDAFLNEREAQTEATPVADAAPEVDSRSAMIADVDNIITSLETLATAVTEMKADWTREFEAFPIPVNEEEAVNEFNALAWAKGQLLAKKQKKVTTMKLKASDMATAAAQLQGAENRDKKAYIMDKKKQLDANVKELQAMINDRAKELGPEAEVIINRVKTKGQIEVIKSQIGNVDPKDAKDMKKRLADLSAKAKEEDEAIADFKAKADAEAKDEKGDDKVQALKDQLAELKADKKDMPKETLADKLAIVKKDIQIALLDAQIKAEDGDANTDPSDADDKAKELKAKAAELEAKIKAEEEEGAAANNDEEGAAAGEGGYNEEFELDGSGRITLNDNLTIENIEENEITEETTEEAVEEVTEDTVSTVQELSSRATAVGLNELATEIDSKLDWQLAEGTTLRLKYEALIRKAEADKTLNESRYFNNNTKDAFRRLL